MKIKFKHMAFLAILPLLGGVSGCQTDEYELGALVAPTGLNVTHQIVGATADDPAGDGTGVVSFSASASEAITFKFDFGDGRDFVMSADGTVDHQFTKPGVNTYYVTVQAIGTGGLSSSKTMAIEVFSSFTDDEAVQFLTAGSEKTWYWAADQVGHLGLGPNDMAYEGGEHTFAAWYRSAVWEKAESTLYQCEFVFRLNGSEMTFEQVNPAGEAFVQGIYAAELGLGDEGSHPFDIAGVKNVSLSPSSSIATVDGGYRGTTMSFSNGGFMGFYAGTSTYEIISVSENQLTVRCVQANNPLFAWYHTFSAVQPVQ